MSLKATIENHPVVVFGSALVMGFIAGFGAFQAITSAAGTSPAQRLVENVLRSENLKLSEQVRSQQASIERLQTEVRGKTRACTQRPDCSSTGAAASGEASGRTKRESARVAGGELATFSDNTTAVITNGGWFEGQVLTVNGQKVPGEARIGQRIQVMRRDATSCYVEYAGGVVTQKLIGAEYHFRFEYVCVEKD